MVIGLIEIRDMDFLDKFILQTTTTSQKTKDYPKDYLDLKIRLSFGQGSPAKIPWISFREPNMTFGYTPVYLFYKEQNILILAYGLNETNPPEHSWTKEIHSSATKISDFIENPFRYGDSYIFKNYSPKIENGLVHYFRDNNEISKKEMENDLSEIINTFKKCQEIEVSTENSDAGKGLFYMEKQLEDFIIHNWEDTELGKKYNLIYEEGELKSQQFPTDIGKIDILAKDKIEDNFVVIELKRNQTSDDTVGQITRYMGWIKKNFGDEKVKGVIVAGKYDEKLDYAQHMFEGIEVFLYEVNFKLNEYRR